MQMELGGPSHEACAGIVALTGYLRTLAELAPSKASEPHGTDSGAKANGHAGRCALTCSLGKLHTALSRWTQAYRPYRLQHGFARIAANSCPSITLGST